MTRTRRCIATCGVMLLGATAKATIVVTFFSDQASFQAAISNATVLDFEGIVSVTGVQPVGEPYHTGSVTFSSTSPPNNPESLLVVGRNAAAVGAPFDSAVLIPAGAPSSIAATFDPGSSVTAVGGFFMDNREVSGTITLTGTSGVLDTRTVAISPASVGSPHSFFGYTVVGDTITGLSHNPSGGAPIIDDFTYGTTPAPATAMIVAAGGAGLLSRRRR